MKISTFSERLAQSLELSGMKAAQLGQICGISKSTLSQYLSGKYEAKYERIEHMARVFGCDPRWLAGHDVPMRWCAAQDGTELPEERSTTLPVLRAVAADGHILAEKNIIGYEYADPKYCDAEHFYLIIEGDSMAPGLVEGDRVLCVRTQALESGSTGVFLVDSDRGLVKQLQTDKEIIKLISINPNWPPIVFRGDERKRVSIIGQVMQSVRNW